MIKKKFSLNKRNVEVKVYICYVYDYKTDGNVLISNNKMSHGKINLMITVLGFTLVTEVMIDIDSHLN